MKNTRKVKPWFRKQDGWWYVTRRINGKRVQIRLVQGLENETQAFHRFYELMVGAEERQVDETLTFNELSHKFIAWSKDNNALSTTKWYLRFLADFDDRYEGVVCHLRKSHVENWLNQQAWGQSTKRQAITCIKCLLN